MDGCKFFDFSTFEGNFTTNTTNINVLIESSPSIAILISGCMVGIWAFRPTNNRREKKEEEIGSQLLLAFASFIVLPGRGSKKAVLG